MYQLYCIEHENAASITKYAEVFHSFNLKFKSPNLDTCAKCDILKTKLDYTYITSDKYIEIKEEQRSHNDEAQMAYNCKDRDKNLCKLNANIKALKRRRPRYH